MNTAIKLLLWRMGVAETPASTARATEYRILHGADSGFQRVSGTDNGFKSVAGTESGFKEIEGR